MGPFPAWARIAIFGRPCYQLVNPGKEPPGPQGSSMHGDAKRIFHFPLFIFFIGIMLLGAVLLGRIVKDFFSDADIILNSFAYLSPGGVIRYPRVFLFRFFNVAVALTALGYVGAASLDKARSDGPAEHARLIGVCLANVGWVAAFTLLFWGLRAPGLLGWDPGNLIYRKAGLLEWAQAVLVAAAAVVFVRSWLRRRGRGLPGYVGAHLLVMALICVVGLGEGLDWGQLLFGWQSPAFFREHNLTGAANFIGMLDRPGTAALYAAGGFLISALVPLSAWVRTRLAPDAPLRLILPGSRWIFTSVLIPCVYQYDEFFELVVALILLCYALRVQARLRRRLRPAA
jgi:hypothetical protein